MSHMYSSFYPPSQGPEPGRLRAMLRMLLFAALMLGAVVPMLAQTVTVSALGAASGWYSDDTRSSAGVVLNGTNSSSQVYFNYPGAPVASTTDDAAIAQQLFFTASGTPSGGGSSVMVMDGTSTNSGKTSVRYYGNGTGIGVLNSSFTSSFRWYMDPYTTSRTVALNLLVLGTNNLVYSFSWLGTGAAANTWHTFSVDATTAPVSDNGWRLYNNGAPGSAAGAAKSLNDWFADPTYGPILSGATVIGQGFNIGSSQRFCRVGIDWLESSLINNGNRVDFVAPPAVYTVCASGCNYTSIQTAVNAASSGDVIQVAAGTYTENVTVNKRLTIQGAGSSATILTSAAGSVPTITVSGTGSSATDRLVIRDMKVTGATGLINVGSGILVQSIAAQSNITIENVDASFNGGVGIAFNGTPSITDVRILNCTLNNNANAGIRIASAVPAFDGLLVDGCTINNNASIAFSYNPDGTVTNVGTNFTISNTTFTNNSTAGVTNAHDISFFAFRGNATLSNVTVTSGNGTAQNSNSYGISIDGGAGNGPLGTFVMNNVTVQGHVGKGALLFQRYTEISGVSLVNVDVSNCVAPWGQMILSHTDADAFAMGNTTLKSLVLWTTGGADATSVVFKHGTTNAILDRTVLADCFQIENQVVHKVDASTLGVVRVKNGEMFVTTTSGSIQRGVDAATAGDVVNVAAGTYVESNILVHKTLTIRGNGASRSDVVIVPAAEDGNVDNAFASNAQNGFLIRANNVKIQNLTINGRGNPALTPGKNNFRIGIVSADASYPGGGGGQWNSLHVDNVHIQYPYRRGISVFPRACFGTLIENSLIENVAFNHAMYVGGQSQILNNVVNNAFKGIVCDPDGTTTNTDLVKVNGNTLSGIGNFPGCWGYPNGQPRAIQCNPNGPARTFEVKNNTISDNGLQQYAGAVGIYTRLWDKNSVIQNNTITLTSGDSWANTGGAQAVGMLLGWSYDNGILVTNNVINSTNYGIGMMVHGNGTLANPLRIEGNTLTSTNSSRLTGGDGDGAGIYVSNQYLFASTDRSTSYAIIRNDNTITGYVKGVEVIKGALPEATQALTVQVLNNDASISGNGVGIDANYGDITITGNDIHSNGTGVRLSAAANLVSATNNLIRDNSGDGILIESGASGSIGAISDNSFTNNTGLAINDLRTASTLDATCNWFGGASAATVQAAVTGNVNVIPYLVSGTDSDNGIVGFQPAPGTCLGSPVVLASATGSDAVCGTGGSIALSFSGGSAPYSISWTGGGSASGITTSPYTISGLNAGSYTATITDANGSMVTSSSVSIAYLPVHNTSANTRHATIQAAINAASAGQLIEVCAGTYTENIIVGQRLTIDGAGSNAGTHINGSITISASGTDATERLVVKDLSVTNMASGGNGMTIGAGFDHIELNNVNSSNNAGSGVNIAGGATTEGLVFTNCVFNDNGTGNSGTGIRMGAGVNIDGFTITGGEVKRNAQIGFSYNSSTSAVGLTNLTITGTVFEKNGIGMYAAGSNTGSGDISLFSWNGNATLNNVTVIGADNASDAAGAVAVQFRGGNTAAPAGTITVNGLSITGHYKRIVSNAVNPLAYGLFVMNYSDVTPISLNNVVVDLGSGHALGVAGLSNTLQLGNMSLNAQAAGYAHIINGTSTQNNVLSNVNATGATFGGVAAATATLAQQFTIEDKVFHAIDASGLGFVRVKNGDVFVTANSFVPSVNTPSIQRGINAAANGDIVNVNDGSYTEAVSVNKANITLRSANGNGVTIIENPNVGSETAGVSVPANMGMVTVDGFTVNNFRNGISQGMASATGTAFIVRNNKVIPENNATNPYLRNGIQVSGNGSQVLNNYVVGAPLSSTWASTGIGVVNASNVLVEGNTVNTASADIGISVLNWDAALVDNITVRNNTVHGAKNGVRISGQAQARVVSNVIIEDNDLTTSPTSSGINVQTVSLNGMTVTGNTITGHNQYSVRISGTSATLSGSILINENSLNGNVGDVFNGTSHPINATNNYWGGCPVVSGPVTFYPYYASATGSAGSLVFDNLINNISASASPATICAGASSTLTGGAGSSFTWSNDLGMGTTKTVTPTATTTYSVSGNDLNNCALGSATVTVTVAPAPTVAIATNGNTLTASGADTYLWSNGATTEEITVNPTTTTTYSVVGTNAAGCTGTASTTVTVITASAGANQFICNGGSATLTATPSGQASYTWSGPNGFTATGESITVNPTSTSAYMVTINGTATASATVFVRPRPTANAGADQTLVGGQATLSGSASGGTAPYTYAWSGAATASGQNPVVTASGSYNLVVTDAFGCTSNNITSVTVFPAQANAYVVSGNVRYNNNLANQQMHNVLVRLVDNSNPANVYTATTPATGNGDYAIPNVPNGTYTVYLSSPMPWGGVTSTDVSRINSHATRPLVGIQRLAADVQLNSTAATVNVGDRDLVNSRRLNPSVVFPTGNWVFTRAEDVLNNSSFSYAHGGSTNNAAAGTAFSNITITVSGTSVTQDFRGLCYGDVDATNAGLKTIQDTEDDWFSLMNFPNPLTSTTTLRFNLPVEGDVYVEVFDLTGARVATLSQPGSVEGTQDMVFDASGLADGLYLYRLSLYTSDDILRQTNRMMITR